ncbi:hypothetical protein [Chroococcus sp. FPU101]|uniref:hypothetical protein n=1 Tax=Chroococcus sp. FPU101 TaxID=1974212 RepID=UPI001A8D64DA|nr:hypothetical protein [Chroococcus sp. FPU101]GFE69930.1 hypothetical protein CFPU101_25400 [Chroococcus sp. FPU101]
MNKFLLATLALSVFPVLGGVPNRAVANPSYTIAQTTSAPQISSFSVESVDDLSPGRELVFSLEGTPKSKVTMSIGTVASNIPMREVRSGYYEARYTIRSQDRITDQTAIQANLQQGNRGATARLQEPLIARENTQDSTNRALSIEQFTAKTVDNFEPGTELVFMLDGTPKANATYSIDGVTYDQPMREVSEGRYEGRYVIRRQDAFPSSGVQVTASLEKGERTVRARLDRDLVASNSSSSSSTELPLEIVSPNNNSEINGTVEVVGKSAPNSTVTINVTAQNNLVGVVGVNRNVFSKTVQADGQGNFSFSFKPSNILPGTRYEISLNATKGTQTNEETLVLVQR